MERSVESKILNFLERVEFGASAVEISRRIDVSRPTILKYLEVMKVKGLVDYKEVGMAKLWHTHKPHLLELLEKEKEVAEHKLKAILDVVGDGVAILDKDMKYRWVNKIYKQQIKRRVKGKLPKIIDNYCYKVIYERNEPCPDCYAQRAFKTGKVERVEKKYKDSKGRTCYYEVQDSPMRDKDGNIVGALIFRRDLTERRRLEKALKASEERYKDIVNNINVGIYRTTPGKKGKHVDVNLTYIEMFGFKNKEEVLNTDVYDTYVDPQEKEEFDRLMKEQGYVKNWETRYKKKDGSILWVRETAVAVHDEKGNIRYYDGIIEDITEIKKLEKALKESEEMYRTIFENVNAGVNRVTPGKKGKFIDANSACVKMLGYDSKEELLKTRPSDHYQNPRDREKFSDKMLKQGYLKDEILKLKKKDGTPFLARENAVAVKDEDGKVRYFDCITEDITERKKLEEALRGSEERYRSLVENAPDAIYSINAKGEFISINSTAVKLLGYPSKEELLGSHFSKVVFPEDLDKAIESFKEQLSGKKHMTERLELRFKTKKKGIIYGELNSIGIYDEKGKFLRSEGVVRDITKRVELEEALKESEERYRSIFENINIGIHRVTPGKKGKFIDVNPAYLKIFDYKNKEELLKANVCDNYQDPKDREKYNEKILKYGYVKDEVLKQKKRNGTPILVRDTAVVVYDENGKPKYFDCMGEDITLMRELEERLEMSEERYRSLVENVPDIVYSLDRKGRIMAVNETASRLLGYSREELLNSHFSKVIVKEDLRKANKSFKELVERKRTLTKGLELRFKTKDGKILWGELSAKATYDKNGNLIKTEGVIRDITERKKIEEKYWRIFESARDAIYISTKDGKLLHINHAGVKLFGYKDRDELLSIDSVRELYVNPKDRERFQEIVEKEGFVRDFKIKLKGKDGKEFLALLTSNARRDEEGEIIGYEGIIKKV
jgi:PAS domain S-box-containing protein